MNKYQFTMLASEEKRLDLYDRLCGDKGKYWSRESSIPMSEAVPLIHCFSVIPKEFNQAKRSISSCMSDTFSIAISGKHSCRVKIVGKMQKFYYFPLFLPVGDLYFCRNTDVLRTHSVFGDRIVGIKMIVDSRDLAAYYSAFGHKIHSFFAFNCFLPEERKMLDSNLYIMEVPFKVGNDIQNIFDEKDISLGGANSHAVNFDFDLDKNNSKLFCRIDVEKDSMSLVESEKEILRRNNDLTSEERNYLSKQKRGYISLKEKYSKNEFISYREFYSKKIWDKTLGYERDRHYAEAMNKVIDAKIRTILSGDMIDD